MIYETPAVHHTFVVDQNTNVSTAKMLILYAKFRPRNDTNYKTVFAGILQSAAIRAVIKHFNNLNHIDMQKMAMFT